MFNRQREEPLIQQALQGDGEFTNLKTKIHADIAKTKEIIKERDIASICSIRKPIHSGGINSNKDT